MTDLSNIPWGYEPDPPAGPPIENGRYVVAGQKYTRVTNFAGTMQERFGLEHWEKRVLARGLGLRPDLAAWAAATPVDNKKDMAQIVESALEAGGRSVDANNGSAIHGFCSGLLTGKLQWSDVPRDFVGDVQALFRELERCGLRQVPELTERTVLNEDYSVVGTFDVGLVDHEGALVLGDIKTGRKIDIAAVEFAIQFALYNHARKMWDPATKTMVAAPPFRTDYALIIHVPHGTDSAFVHRVDTNLGYAAARVAAEVRALRKLNEIVTPYVPNTPTLVTPPGGISTQLGEPFPGATLPAVPTAVTVETARESMADPDLQEVIDVEQPAGPVRFTLDTPEQAHTLFTRLSEHGATGLAAGDNWVDVPEQHAPFAATLVSTIVPQGVEATEQAAFEDGSGPPPGSAQDSENITADELFDLFPTAGRKSALQTLAKRVSSEIKPNQHADRLAAAIVADAAWPAHRGAVLAELREAREARRPGRPRKASDDAPAPVNQAEVPPPPPTAAEVDAALSPQAQQHVDNVATIRNGVNPSTGQPLPGSGWPDRTEDRPHTAAEAAGTPSVPFEAPFITKDAEWYRRQINQSSALTELHLIANDGFAALSGDGLGQPADIMPNYYGAWIKLAATPNDITTAVEHSKQTGFVWPHDLAQYGQQRWTELNTRSV